MSTTSLKDILANNVSKQRKRVGLTQKELALKLGITSDSVAHIEQGINAPKFSRIEDLAMHLNCSVSYLLNDNTLIDKNVVSERARIIDEMLSSVSEEAQEIILDMVSHAVKVMSEKK